MALADLLGVPQSFIKPFTAEEHESELVVNNLINPVHLAMPPLANPMSCNANFMRDEHGREIKINYNHGTTTLGFLYKNGVVMAVDSRATGGQYIGSQNMRKVVHINKYLIGTIAGGAADCVYWDRVLVKQCRLYELRNKQRISTAAASKLMSNMAFTYKGMGLSMGMMIAGYDKNGPSLYYVDSEGQRTKGSIYSVGSGSVYAFGVLDSGYKFDLEDEDAYELARRSIYHATFRDSYSGGIVRVYHMKSTGWEIISEQDCLELHNIYNPNHLLS